VFSMSCGSGRMRRRMSVAQCAVRRPRRDRPGPGGGWCDPRLATRWQAGARRAARAGGRDPANATRSRCPASPARSRAAALHAPPKHRRRQPSELRAARDPLLRRAVLTVRSKYLLFSPYLACTLTEALRREGAAMSDCKAACRRPQGATCCCRRPPSARIERTRLGGRVRAHNGAGSRGGRCSAAMGPAGGWRGPWPGGRRGRGEH
jgi:hypothetical protein